MIGQAGCSETLFRDLCGRRRSPALRCLEGAAFFFAFDLAGIAQKTNCQGLCAQDAIAGRAAIRIFPTAHRDFSY